MERINVAHVKYELLKMGVDDYIDIDGESYSLIDYWNPPPCGFNHLNICIFKRKDGKYFRFASLLDDDNNRDPDNFITEITPKKISFLYFDEIGIKKEEVENLINKNFLCPTYEINIS